MAGRPQKPSHLKLVEGNRGKRAMNSHEPDPDYLNDLTPPEHLPVWAHSIWVDLAPKLRAAKVLTVLDTEVLAQLCISIAQYREATYRLNLDFISFGQKGQSLNQLMVAQSMAFKQSNAIMQQFGMTPAARTRVVVNSQGDLFGNEKTGTDYLT
jgi:P27 family predicted phage terminase small subunit